MFLYQAIIALRSQTFTQHLVLILPAATWKLPDKIIYKITQDISTTIPLRISNLLEF